MVKDKFNFNIQFAKTVALQETFYNGYFNILPDSLEAPQNLRTFRKKMSLYLSNSF